MFNKYGTKITQRIFDEVILPGSPCLNTQVKLYQMERGNMTVELINYGATIRAIKVPDRYGNTADVVLGYDSLKGYMKTKNNPYFGATIGRVTNRIAKGTFELDGVVYQLSKNSGENTLHGGCIGFDKKIWNVCVDDEGVVMTTVSEHLEEGFPGRLEVYAKFVLCDNNRLVIKYKARTDRTTVVNMTNHSYFNLNGHNAGAKAIYNHKIMINAFNFTPTDDNLIPKGKIQDVYGTCLDLTEETLLGDAIKATEEANGFDINYCINGESSLKFVARVTDPVSGRKLEITSNQPGVQFYTANCLAVKDGKEGATYGPQSAFCLETQNYPNAVNEKNFPSSVLHPRQTYEHIICYQFGVVEEEGSPTTKEFSEMSLKDYDLELDEEGVEKAEVTTTDAEAEGTDKEEAGGETEEGEKLAKKKSKESKKSKGSSKKSLKGSSKEKKGDESKSTMGSGKGKGKKGSSKQGSPKHSTSSKHSSKPGSPKHESVKEGELKEQSSKGDQREVESMPGEVAKAEPELDKSGDHQSAASTAKSGDAGKETMPSARSISNLLDDHTASKGASEGKEEVKSQPTVDIKKHIEGEVEGEDELEYIECPHPKRVNSITKVDTINKEAVLAAAFRPVEQCLTDWSTIDLRKQLVDQIKLKSSARCSDMSPLLATLTTDITLSVVAPDQENKWTSTTTLEASLVPMPPVVSNIKTK